MLETNKLDEAGFCRCIKHFFSEIVFLSVGKKEVITTLIFAYSLDGEGAHDSHDNYHSAQLEECSNVLTLPLSQVDSSTVRPC